MAAHPLPRLRALCLTLPEAHEAEAWGEPTFRVRNRLFAMCASPDCHRGAGRAATWVKATPRNQALMVQAAPERFFVPPYVGPSGWVSVWLDRRPDWGELAVLLLASAFRSPTAGRCAGRHQRASPHVGAERLVRW